MRHQHCIKHSCPHTCYVGCFTSHALTCKANTCWKQKSVQVKCWFSKRLTISLAQLTNSAVSTDSTLLQVFTAFKQQLVTVWVRLSYCLLIRTLGYNCIHHCAHHHSLIEQMLQILKDASLLRKDSRLSRFLPFPAQSISVGSPVQFII